MKVSAIKPPAPSPCTARKAISWVMLAAAPDANEPIKKVMIAN